MLKFCKAVSMTVNTNVVAMGINMVVYTGMVMTRLWGARRVR